jgi:hypothetical protein
MKFSGEFMSLKMDDFEARLLIRLLNNSELVYIETSEADAKIIILP